MVFIKGDHSWLGVFSFLGKPLPRLLLSDDLKGSHLTTVVGGYENRTERIVSDIDDEQVIEFS